MPYLTDLAAIARKTSLEVIEVAGWETRGRGPMSDVRAVVCHHTATLNRTADMPSLNTLINGRPDLSGPLSQFGLSRSGKVYVIAAGALQPCRGGAEPLVGQQPRCWHRGRGHRHRRDVAAGSPGGIRPALPRARRLLRAERLRRARSQGGSRPTGPEAGSQLRHARVPSTRQCARWQSCGPTGSSTTCDPAPYGDTCSHVVMAIVASVLALV